jgi:hypothetical protein
MVSPCSGATSIAAPSPAQARAGPGNWSIVTTNACFDAEVERKVTISTNVHHGKLRVERHGAFAGVLALAPSKTQNIRTAADGSVSVLVEQAKLVVGHAGV